MPLAIQRKNYSEAGALADLAFQFQPRPHELDQMADNPEAESSTGLARTGAAEAGELLEDVLPLVRGNAWSGIAHLHHPGVVAARREIPDSGMVMARFAQDHFISNGTLPCGGGKASSSSPKSCLVNFNSNAPRFSRT